MQIVTELGKRGQEVSFEEQDWVVFELDAENDVNVAVT